MSNWLLVVVGIIFVLCILNGGIKGLFKIAISLLASVITIVLVIFLSPYVQEVIIEYTVLDEFVQEKCMEIFMPDLTASMLEGKDLTGTVLEEFSEEELNSMEVIDWDVLGMTVDQVIGITDEITKDQQIRIIENSNFPEFIKDLLLENNNNTIYETLGVTRFTEYAAAYISNLVVKVVAFLLTFVFAFIIVKALSAAIDIIGELPVIGFMNHFGGAVLGIAQAVLIVWIIFLVITVCCTTEIGQSCFEMIEDNSFLSFLYDTNILLKKLLYD